MIKLSPQQEKFAQEIVKGKTQSDAYRTAYPKSLNWKDDSVHNKSSALMRDAQVLARVAELRTPVIEELKITAEYVLGTIMRVIEVSGQTKNAPDGTEVLVDPAAVLKGSELLGKHLKLFTDKTEATVAQTINVKVVNEFDNH